LWCNQDGKDGNYALYGMFFVKSIERMDIIFPQIQDGQPSRTIRSQTLYPLSYGCVVERLYLFRGEKSRNGSGGGVFLDISIGSWCNPGAINRKITLFRCQNRSLLLGFSL